MLYGKNGNRKSLSAAGQINEGNDGCTGIIFEILLKIQAAE